MAAAVVFPPPCEYSSEAGGPPAAEQLHPRGRRLAPGTRPASRVARPDGRGGRGWLLVGRAGSPRRFCSSQQLLFRPGATCTASGPTGGGAGGGGGFGAAAGPISEERFERGPQRHGARVGPRARGPRRTAPAGAAAVLARAAGGVVDAARRPGNPRPHAAEADAAAVGVGGSQDGGIRAGANSSAASANPTAASSKAAAAAAAAPVEVEARPGGASRRSVPPVPRDNAGRRRGAEVEAARAVAASAAARPVRLLRVVLRVFLFFLVLGVRRPLFDRWAHPRVGLSAQQRGIEGGGADGSGELGGRSERREGGGWVATASDGSACPLANEGGWCRRDMNAKNCCRAGLQTHETSEGAGEDQSAQTVSESVSTCSRPSFFMSSK